MIDFQEIRDTTPLSIKSLNDQMRMLWYKSKNITSKDIRVNSIEAKHIKANAIEAEHIKTGELVVGDNVGLGTAQDATGVVRIVNGTVTADYVNALGIKAESIIGGSFLGKTFTGGEFIGSTFRTEASLYEIEINGGMIKSFSSDLSNSNAELRIYSSQIYAENSGAGIYSRFDLIPGQLTISSQSPYYSASIIFPTHIQTPRINSQYINTNRITGTPDSEVVYFGNNSCHIKTTGGNMRIQANEGIGITVDLAGGVTFYHYGTPTHSFAPNGTKAGGSIKIDGEVYGMSPIDSPRILLADTIENVELNGETIVKIDPLFAKTMKSYIIMPNKPVEIIEKNSDNFTVIGEGIVDFLIIGKRIEHEDTYWVPLPKLEEEPQNKQTLQSTTPAADEKLKLYNITKDFEVMK